MQFGAICAAAIAVVPGFEDVEAAEGQEGMTGTTCALARDKREEIW